MTVIAAPAAVARNITKSVQMITLASAPVPAAFAATGFSSFHIRKRMRPRSGMMKPSKPHGNAFP